VPLPRHLIAALALSIAAGNAQAWGVSGRHLQGAAALDCDLEAAPREFRLEINGQARSLNVEGSTVPIPYEEVSETALRFRFAPPGGPELGCTLELPAGALTCIDKAGVAQVGFCLMAP
jgi:hypothetical protein